MQCTQAKLQLKKKPNNIGSHARQKKNYAVSKQCASNLYFLIHHIPALCIFRTIVHYIILYIKCTHEREERKEIGFAGFGLGRKNYKTKLLQYYSKRRNTRVEYKQNCCNSVMQKAKENCKNLQISSL